MGEARPIRVLILAPLAVAQQTAREGERFGIPITVARKQSDVVGKITVANYEMLHHFNPLEFDAVVLDESSILKSYDGKTRTQIIEYFARTPFKLACTATPAPNDHMELANHAEFLGVMTRQEMLSMFFVHDGGETQKWRIKGHAQTDFWKWICSWAVNIRKPSDLGFSDEGYELPPLEIAERLVYSTAIPEGCLFPMEALTLQERLQSRKASTKERVAETANIILRDNGHQWIVWCNLNEESAQMTRAIPGAVEVKGSDSNEHKQKAVLDFTEGRVRVLVSKASIFGFGLNLQNCCRMAFLGLSDSYEEFYQAVRRCWRFGQDKSVEVNVVIANTEAAVMRNVKRKEAEARKMADEMVEHMSEISKGEIQGAGRDQAEYKTGCSKGRAWTLWHGDCVDAVAALDADSIHYSVFSPPFASLYTYSNSDRDMGNSKDTDTFYKHFAFLIQDLFRVTMPGRLLSFHCMNLPTSKTHDGFIGIKDFRGELIRLFIEAGFIYHSEVVIWKDPVTAMQRTKALGLLHKQLKKDSCMSRQGIPDYLVTMRKPGENAEPVAHTNETFPVQVWQRYASPVWMDINPSDTLQFRSAREHDDERHICPLQLQVIRRALELWTNPGDLVLSPFAGIGSEGYEAIRAGRRFVGAELKESYYRQACANLRAAEQDQQGLFAPTTAA